MKKGKEIQTPKDEVPVVVVETDKFRVVKIKGDWITRRRLVLEDRSIDSMDGQTWTNARYMAGPDAELFLLLSGELALIRDAVSRLEKEKIKS